MNRRKNPAIVNDSRDVKNVMRMMMSSIQTLEILIEDAKREGDTEKIRELTKKLAEERRYWTERLEGMGAKVSSSRNNSAPQDKKKNVQGVETNKERVFGKNCRALAAVITGKESAEI